MDYIELITESTPEEILTREEYLISKYNILHLKYGYNIAINLDSISTNAVKEKEKLLGNTL